MAVQKQRIKDRLKIYTKANLSETRIDAIADRLSKIPEENADDAQIDEVIKQYDLYNSFDDIAREDDRVRNIEAKLNKKLQKTEPKKPETPEPTKPTDEKIPAYVQKILDDNAKLLEKVTGIENNRILDTKINSARSEFIKSETFKSMNPETQDFYFRQIDVNSETPIKEQILKVEGIFNDSVQSHANANNYSITPQKSSAEIKPDAELIKATAERMASK